MATIFYVADGTGIDSTTTAGVASAADVATKLKSYHARLAEDNPVINPHLPFSKFHRNVVVQIASSEVNDTFKVAGFYEMVGLTATKCQELLSLAK